MYLTFVELSCTCVWKRSWDDVAQRGFDGTSKWLPSMGICSCHKSPTTKHCVSRCPPHHCLVAISECFGRQRVNQVAKQPEIHVINMEYASSYAVWHELWMLCSACKICDGSTTATRCRICIWWAIWQCCIEFIILAVYELIWACADTCVNLFTFFLLWDDAFVCDEKNRLYMALLFLQ